MRWSALLPGLALAHRCRTTAQHRVKLTLHLCACAPAPPLRNTGRTPAANPPLLPATLPPFRLLSPWWARAAGRHCPSTSSSPPAPSRHALQKSRLCRSVRALAGRCSSPSCGMQALVCRKRLSSCCRLPAACLPPDCIRTALDADTAKVKLQLQAKSAAPKYK